MPGMDLIIPIRRNDPFDDPAWLFELKLDGFRGLADTIAGRMLSKNGNRMRRFSGDYIANGQRGTERTEKHVKHESM
jgi:ATP-dependent DNA ligase